MKQLTEKEIKAKADEFWKDAARFGLTPSDFVSPALSEIQKNDPAKTFSDLVALSARGKSSLNDKNSD